MKTRILIILLAISNLVHAQLPVGEWRDHLPYKNAKVLALGNHKIYCATDQAIFYYDFSDNSVNRLTKINGLSDTDIGYIAYNKPHNTLIVAYNNGNIDLISDGKKTNIPDVKFKNIIANKTMNHIYVTDDYAYVSTGFGIIVINIIKAEIADSYIIGDQGEYLAVKQTIVAYDSIYALTDRNLYVADFNNNFLANFENWHIDSSMNFYGDRLIGATLVKNQLFLTHSPDTSDLCYLHKMQNHSWIYAGIAQYYTQKLFANANYFIFIGKKQLKVYDTSLKYIGAYTPEECYDALYTDNDLWIADYQKGLTKINADQQESFFSPKGPNSANTFDLYSNNGQILVAPGGYQNTGENLYSHADVYSYNHEKWENIVDFDNETLNSIRDVVTFTSNQKNGTYLAGTWGYGIFEVQNNQITQVYNADNTDGILGNYIGGMTYDNAGNLWVVCRNSDYPFVVKTPDNRWYHYNYDGQWNGVQTYKVVQAQNGDFWTICYRSGRDIYVWNSNNTPENGSDDSYNSFSIRDEDNSSVSSALNDIAVDIDGNVWIATGDGVVVYDNPYDITDGSITHYARRPQLVIDGYLKDLLKGEMVTSIAIDGANRKWFGTAGGGVFLVSADGTEQIINWNAENSNLFSDNITDITINANTGEIFFATDKGIQSYMGTSTVSESDYNDIYAFPNPVRKDYNGYITIRGLMYQTDVKITDLTGHLVFSTTSNGGDALWNGKDLTGKPVSSGIYLVLCTTPDGTEAEATKIMFIK